MKILHVLDHSLPIFSGYSFRSSNILQFQKTIGMEPIALTSPKHGREGTESEEIGGIRYFRTPEKGRISLAKLPLFKEALVIQRLRKRLRQVVNSENGDLSHSHSPSLNGFPAWLVSRRCRIPFVDEARAFWEDAAVDHGTFYMGAL